LSVVIPVYECATCLRALHERLTRALRSLGISYELIFVDDRSRDDGWKVLGDLARCDPTIRAFRLSRNFGQHPAITAGLERSRGRWAVVMDCDLQDPPEAIPDLYRKASEGFDVVLGRRLDRRGSTFRRWASRLYFSVLNAVAGTRLSSDYGNFSL